MKTKDLMPKPVLTKHDFVRRYKTGEFGNRAPTWDKLPDWMSERWSMPVNQLYHVRNRIAGEKTWYNLKWKEVSYFWYEASKEYSSKNLYISAMAPHDKGLIQGEIRRSHRGLELYWTMATLPMRQAFKELGGAVETGITAKTLLEAVLDPLSYEWVQYLLDAYPDHIVEFSSFGCNWGTIPNRNTIIWEVRLY